MQELSEGLAAKSKPLLNSAFEEGVITVGTSLQWLRRNGNEVHHFAAACRPQYLEAALAAVTGKALTSALLTNASSFAVTVSAGFPSLNFCSLASDGEDLDLGPFQDLPNLQQLTLSRGVFSNIGAAPSLTSLVMMGTMATAGTDGKLFSNLQDLALRDSTLSHIHPAGVSACTALTRLICVNSYMYGGSEAEQDDMLANMQLPPRIRNLKDLRLFLYSAADSSSEDLDLQCLSGLTNLRLVCI